MTYRYYLILFFAILAIGCAREPQKIDEIAIIPKPTELTINEGVFVFDEPVSITLDQQFISSSTYIVKLLNAFGKLSSEPNPKGKQIKVLQNVEIENEEGYRLQITSNEIRVEAKSQGGIFYAMQSLQQLIPVYVDPSRPLAIPCVDIRDEPQFKYRGMHLDVGRHMYSVDFIKKYISMMSLLKLNTFHWHLTEDQGWRIEIKKYPKLQEIAAFRKETLVGHYSDQPHQFDGEAYGGFYTQEQIKEIVAYAQERNITIIPEIEMPGHSQAAIAAYPELGCASTGSATHPIEVATKWGVFEEVYCPTEKTFQFLEDVIDEVVELFPAKYIHIGGDEAPKTRWENCSYCQKLIKEKGLKDENGLQSYFIQRMEKYINSKGKQIIGWDEILEGGLAPNATVMSWRGTSGAVEAAKEGHDVILTPTSHCYFDYYQSEDENEPLAIGGFIALEKVYSFNPIPEELSADEAKYVLGAQGNVWTEYMPDSRQVEYMAFPRMIALSEVVWSKTEDKDYDDFVGRLEHYQKRMDLWDVNYANHIYEVKGALKNDSGKLSYELTTTSDSYPIYYALDDTEPSLEYKNPIEINSSTTIKAVVKGNGKNLGNVFKQEMNLHKAVGATISIDKEPHPSYNAGGKVALINGISGHNKRYGDKEWLGFWGEDIEISIEFDQPKVVNSISTRFHNGNGQWIYAPKMVFINYYLEDGRVITSAKKPSNIDLLVPYEFISKDLGEEFESIKTRKVKISVPSYGVIPKDKQGGGHKAWTFIDEIIIE